MRWEGDGDLRFVHEPLTWFNSRPALHLSLCTAIKLPSRRSARPLNRKRPRNPAPAIPICNIDRCMRLLHSSQPI